MTSVICFSVSYGSNTEIVYLFFNVLFKKPKIQSFSPREKKIFKEKMNLPWVLPERG